MLANESIQYEKRMIICADGKAPTTQDLRDSLNRFIKGQCGNFRVVIKPATKKDATSEPSLNVLSLIIHLDLFVYLGHGDFPASKLIFEEVTHYTLSDHNRTLTLD